MIQRLILDLRGLTPFNWVWVSVQGVYLLGFGYLARRVIRYIGKRERGEIE